MFSFKNTDSLILKNRNPSFISFWSKYCKTEFVLLKYGETEHYFSRGADWFGMSVRGSVAVFAVV